MRSLTRLQLTSQERKAIAAFSRRLRKALGKRLVTVLLFGSRARGDGKKDSDIDVFVLVRKQTVSALSIVAKVTSEVWWDYNVLLSPVTYDLEEQEKNVLMGSFFFESVKAEGVRI